MNLFSNTAKLQKFLMAMGALFLALLTALVLFLLYVYLSGKWFDHQSENYAEDAAKAIVANWDADQLMQRAHPKLKEVKREDIDKMFVTLRALGGLKTLYGCNGESTVRYFTNFSRAVSASYLCDSEFDTGPAVIRIDSVRDSENGWQIVSFYVDSKALNKPKDKDKK